MPLPTEDTVTKKSAKTVSDSMLEQTTDPSKSLSKSSSEANGSVTLAALSPGLNPTLGTTDATKIAQCSCLGPLEYQKTKITLVKAMDSKCGADLDASLGLG